ncbi:hypothetical protein Tco_0379102 [Tanacetum coccineum]
MACSLPHAIDEIQALVYKLMDEDKARLTMRFAENLEIEECSTSGSEDEEYAMAVRDFKKFFKRRGRFVRQPRNYKKTFQRIRDDKNGKSDRKCFDAAIQISFGRVCKKQQKTRTKEHCSEVLRMICSEEVREGQRRDVYCSQASNEIWDNEDVHDLRSVETEFPAIVFNDTLTSEATLSCEPTVSSLNDNEIDFRISFDESDDEDYTPTVSCFDDLDFFKDFENEFPAIVYNDALTSKSDFLTEPTVSPQHIDEFNLKDETSLSEYDEEEQNVLYFNDLFSFNVIYPDDSKSDEDNDDDKIDI